MLLATILLLALGGQDQSGSCRVLPQPVFWQETRTINSVYTRPEPLTDVHLDLCVNTTHILAAENRTPSANGQVSFSGMGIRVQLAFDPGFTQIVSDAVVNISDVGFVMLPFDGRVNFRGPSGASLIVTQNELHATDLVVSDEDFFRAPFQVYIRAMELTTFDIQGTGAFTALADPACGVGASFIYNGSP